MNHHFNTSHVSINQFRIIRKSLRLWHFNTSHVSINQAKLHHVRTTMVHFNTSHVSINLLHRSYFWPYPPISIHLMFLLIMLQVLRHSLPSNISIHLMFLLIFTVKKLGRFKQHFNTSHVSINHCATPTTVISSPTISIHLMFLLIRNMFINGFTLWQFQYISCFY